MYILPTPSFFLLGILSGFKQLDLSKTCNELLCFWSSEETIDSEDPTPSHTNWCQQVIAHSPGGISSTQPRATQKGWKLDPKEGSLPHGEHIFRSRILNKISSLLRAPLAGHPLWGSPGSWAIAFSFASPGPWQHFPKCNVYTGSFPQATRGNAFKWSSRLYALYYLKSPYKACFVVSSCVGETATANSFTKCATL